MAERFSGARAAKEYLIEHITAQAKKDGVDLSEVERKMLFFTEKGWTLPDMPEVSAKFDEEYDQDQYEAKIAWLVSRIHETAGEADEEKWNDAVEVLSSEDHYLLVLINPRITGGRRTRAKGGLAKPILVGALIAAMVMLGIWIYWRLQ